MKRFACALALVVAALMLPRTASAQSGLVWTTNGVLSNPATNAIFADFQNVEGAHVAKTFRVVCSSTVSAVAIIEHRDAANATVVGTHTQAVILNAGITFETMNVSVQMQDQEHIRLRLNTGITGLAQCSIFAQ